MKYNIEINQVVLSKTVLDIVDSAILNYLIFICNSKSIKIERQRKGDFTWIDYSHLLKEMPLLRIKSISALSPRMKRIEKEGYIEIDRSEHQKLYARLTKKIDELFTNMNSTPNTKGKKAIHEEEPIIILDKNHNTSIYMADSTINNHINKIFEEYTKKVLPGSRLTTKAKDKIRTRLKEYSAINILKAIDNFSKDEWWMENNARRGIAWFFHTEDRMEQFLNLVPREKQENKKTLRRRGKYNLD